MAAFRVMATGSIDDVKVERLAADLGVTKGSFYWHFADRSALLAAIRDRWVELDTEAVIDFVDRASEPDDPVGAMEQLFLLIFSSSTEPGGIEAAIREWSARDPEMAERCQAVDERRLTYVTDLLVAAGLEADVARGRAEVLYRMVIGEAVSLRYGGTPLEPGAVLEVVRRLAQP
jgi:AcrR family transcriptional regulator